MNLNPSDDTHSLVVFRVAGQAFALAVDDVREVVPIAWLAKPPQLPSVVEGILNLAGQAVCVLRLDALLGLTGRPPGLDASILVMKGEQPFGLMVERVDGVRQASEYAPAAVSERGSFNGCLAAVLSRGGETVHLLSWRRLLLEEERVRVAEYGRFAQARLDMLVDVAP